MGGVKEHCDQCFYGHYFFLKNNRINIFFEALEGRYDASEFCIRNYDFLVVTK